MGVRVWWNTLAAETVRLLRWSFARWCPAGEKPWHGAETVATSMSASRMARAQAAVSATEMSRACASGWFLAKQWSALALRSMPSATV